MPAEHDPRIPSRVERFLRKPKVANSTIGSLVLLVFSGELAMSGSRPSAYFAAALLVGCLLAASLFAIRLRWRVSIGLVGMGAVAAMAAWWFVPDTQGFSRFQARTQIPAIERSIGSIEPGDFGRFRAALIEYGTIGRAYPEYLASPKITDAGWFSRTVDQVDRRSGAELARKPGQALEDRLLLMKELGEFPSDPERVRATDRAFALCLEAAQAEAVALIRDDRYPEANARALNFRDRLSGSSPPPLAAEKVARFVEGLAFLSDLQRIAKSGRR